MTTSTDRPDTALRAWLELGPDRGRREGLERALAATRRVPQRPGWSFPERWLPVNRTFLAASAALIVVAVAVGLALRPSSSVGPATSPTPPPASATQTVTATHGGGLIPDELKHTWVGAPHAIAGHPDVQALNIGFQFGQLHLAVNDVYGQDAFTSDASIVGPNTLELRALANGCDLGVIGRYRWTLSPGGTLLHLQVVDDPCAARSAGLVGEWHAADCKDTTDMCWGDLEAGTYPTLFYSPRATFEQELGPNYAGVTFTVPEGWAEGGDFITNFRLLRARDYAKETPIGLMDGQQTQIEGWIRPALVGNGTGGCEPTTSPTAEVSVDAAMTWLQRRQSGVVATPAHGVTIDGHAGRYIDVSLSPDWTATCGFDKPTVALMTEAVRTHAVGDVPWVVGISGEARIRLVFLDVSRPELKEAHTAMIAITAPDQATFDAFVDEAMPIVESLHFK